MSSMFGNNIRISVAGQSHSSAIGVTIDGLPSGFKIDMEELGAFLQRRAPGRNLMSTQRREADLPEFLSGIVDDTTCGAPLLAIIKNTNTRSSDYDNLRDIPRPSHADFTANVKYGGFQDVAGGGHFSGRLTAPLCIAGGMCKQWLEGKGIRIGAHIASIAGIQDSPVKLDWVNPDLNAISEAFPVVNPSAGQAMQEEIAKAKADGDSVGGIIECFVTGLPVGLGDPMFDGIENKLAQIIYGIPAVKGLEFGSGFAGTTMRGSENNDPYAMIDGKIKALTNNAGGILGGITTGMPLVFKVAIKPTPSIAKPQQTVNLKTLQNEEFSIQGRHDPCIVPRAVPVVEAAAAIAIFDICLKDGFI